MVGGRGFVLEPLFRRGGGTGCCARRTCAIFRPSACPENRAAFRFNCPPPGGALRTTPARWKRSAQWCKAMPIQRLVRFLQRICPALRARTCCRRPRCWAFRSRTAGRAICPDRNDYTSQARFADRVARGDWYIDVHSATEGLFHHNTYQDGNYYEIPYRSMVQCNTVKNAAAAGRCISATF